jgi:EAL domain-containing protein (putative c-di-GMP-specific phosphodiesterase class I)
MKYENIKDDKGIVASENAYRNRNYLETIKILENEILNNITTLYNVYAKYPLKADERIHCGCNFESKHKKDEEIMRELENMVEETQSSYQIAIEMEEEEFIKLTDLLFKVRNELTKIMN